MYSDKVSFHLWFHTSKTNATKTKRPLLSQFSLPADLRQWGTNLSRQDREPDDDLHNPDPRRDHRTDRGGSICTARGILNLGCLVILSAGLLMMFAGYPLLSYFLMKKPATTNGGFNIGGINATGQVSSTLKEEIYEG